MASLFIYILKANILILITLACYQMLCQKLSFHQWKRFFLIFGIISAFIAPLLHWNYLKMIPITEAESSLVPQNFVTELINTPSAIETGYNYILISFLWVYIIGILFSARKLWKSYTTLRSITNSATLIDDDLGVYHHPHIDTAFSTWSRIYINQNNIAYKDYHNIILHEHKHVIDYHSFDLWMINITRAIFWFNPLLKLYQSHIVQNNECIVDEYVSKKVPLKEYQLQLVKYQTSTWQLDLISPFALTNLKQRIMFMNQQQSPKWKLSLLLGSCLVISSASIALAVRTVPTNYAEHTSSNTSSDVIKDMQKEKKSVMLVNGDTIKPVSIESNKNNETVKRYNITSDNGKQKDIAIKTTEINDKNSSTTTSANKSLNLNVENSSFNVSNASESKMTINGKEKNITMKEVHPEHIKSMVIKAGDDKNKQSIEIKTKEEYQDLYK
jgi:hypothetical protein